MLSRDEFEKALESMLGAGALAIRNADAVRRLLEFIQQADPSHDSLAYLVNP